MNDDDGIVTDDVVDELSDSKQNIFIFLYNSGKKKLIIKLNEILQFINSN